MGFDILGTGSFVGSKKITNSMLSEVVKRDEEWILQRTGIEQRYYAKENEDVVSMAFEASKEAINKACISKDDIKVLIVASFSSEMLTPSVACMLQEKLELSEDVFAFDINAACSGFVYALKIASALFYQGEKGHALVVGAELISRLLDNANVGTGILFGDGAAATVLRPNKDKRDYFYMGTKGNTNILSCIGANRRGERPVIKMLGQEVFKFAVNIVPKCIENVLNQALLKKEDVKYFVFHQANERIIASVRKKLDLNEESIYMNIEKYGNTSAASIGILLAEMEEKKMLERGDRLVIVGFGSGLTWGAGLISW